MPPPVPYLVLDTGSLLTLLLGGELHQPGFSHAKLLLDSAREGLVNIVIPDMVAAEFLGSIVPLYARDFNGTIGTESIPFGFACGRERIAFLKALLDLPNAHLTQTPCGDEYLQRLHGLMVHNPGYQRKQDSHWPPTPEELRLRLFQPKSQLGKAIRQNMLLGADGDTTNSGRPDRGELAAGDATQLIHRKLGKDYPVFVLFEGKDVRGRIVQRLNSSTGSESYHQWASPTPLKHFNPNMGEQFDQTSTEALGNLNFLSTKAFLAGFMKAAKTLCVSDRIANRPPWYILHPNEATDKKCVDEGYADLIRNVNEKGLGRIYDKYRDRHVSNMLAEEESEYAIINNIPQAAPWMQQVTAWLDDAPARNQLRRIIHDYTRERQDALLHDAETRLTEILRNVPMMWPATRHALLGMLSVQHAELLEQTRRHSPPDR